MVREGIRQNGKGKEFYLLGKWEPKGISLEIERKVL